MHSSFFEQHKGIKDAVSIVVFVVLVVLGTLFINAFIFRSFNVEGPSMETTLHTGDRLIVNRLPVTWAQLQNKPYIPSRGQVIVFKNPQYDSITNREEYIVKRVIGLPGERVVLKDGHYTVYNSSHPNGFNPDDDNNGEPGSYTTGTYDGTVADGTLFVSGDHRKGNCSEDSRNGLGMIPLYDVVGPVSLRIFPFNQVRSFSAGAPGSGAGKVNNGNNAGCEQNG